MKVYLAFSNTYLLQSIDTSNSYGLFSYHYAKNSSTLINYIDKWEDFILDSGIFTFLNGKDCSKIDWEEYLHHYANFVIKHNIKNYVEIDIDRIVGLAEVERLRNKLEKKVGRKSIPVWHMNRGYDKWLEICKDYDYICFGAFITDGLKKNKYDYIKKFLHDARKNNCKVHGLGMTDFEWLNKLKFYSVDSSTWSSGQRYGEVHVFTGDKIKKYRKPRDKKFIDVKDISIFNLKEWVKFVNYAKNNL